MTKTNLLLISQMTKCRFTQLRQIKGKFTQADCDE